MIEDVIDTVASRAIDKGLEINYLMEADVPSMVIGDRFRIRQVLINLVGNAVKFTAHGEVHIRCSLLRESSEKLKGTEVFLNFDVVDTGKGFSSEDAERLMQRFSQLGENGSQQHAGSGLGLFLSKQLVEMHGGKLTPSSKEGQGAQFSFNVKIDAPPPPSPSERPSLLRHASTVSRRPATSRTTSYEQSSLLAPRSHDQFINLASLSPGLDSPELDLGSKGSYPLSAASSALPTPDISTAQSPPGPTSSIQSHSNFKEGPSSAPVRLTPPLSQGSASPSRLSMGSPPASPQGPFSIVILCPLDNTRKATKQHIEQVVPYEIPFTIKTLPDIDEWKDMMQPSSGFPCTHLVLNLPATDDILEVIQHISETETNTAPVVVIISDLYQKRQISTRVKELAATGKQVFIVPKPVKPSAFSTIFDPDSKRELSKDRNQDMAREINNNFKTVSKMVKEVLGNKGYRILLVEDDETNRDVSSLVVDLTYHSTY
jgi:CheY-like chemotaxis protein